MRINRLFLPLETKEVEGDRDLLTCSGEIELKFAKTGDEAPAEGEEDDGEITGYGAIFSKEDQGGDIILPGAFKKTLTDIERTKQVIPILWQHNRDMPIGVWNTFAEDDRGLKCSGTLFGGLQQARDALYLLKRKGIKGLSIGYRTVEADIDQKTFVRKIKTLQLFEVSLVTFPMQPKANITQVKTDLSIPTEREMEEAYREGGLSQREAKIAVAITKKMVLRDGATDEQPRREGAGDLLIATRRLNSLFS
ncbi:MAG TPA: HK97 family phage prohead protease [Devosia sp.]|nr:HK97 family phage prohead protease [Devosia sp.]